jgi:hypothetical protein
VALDDERPPFARRYLPFSEPLSIGVGSVSADPVAAAAFLLGAFVLAGAAQTAWFASSLSQRFKVPIDGGLTFRGRRILGEHKTLRGFVVMVPAAAASFTVLAAWLGTSRLWPLSLGAYASLGAVAGFGFMAGELPNSFVKRQIGIAPGMGATGPIRSAAQFAIDRLDSGLGMLCAVRLLVPLSPMTWALVLLAGPPLHWMFSVLMFRLGLKARPA